MSYSQRAKFNPYDSYMNGLCLWLSPRQIIILDDFLNSIKSSFLNDADKEAFLDFKSQIDHEAEIKRRKYFGGDDEEDCHLFSFD